MAIFIGGQVRSVDAKGRSPVPKDFRQEMDEEGIHTLILAIDPDPDRKVVQVFPLQDWRQVVEQIEELEPDDDLEPVSRLFLDSARRCWIDRAGRVLIPPEHRGHLELDDQVYWSGQGHSIELQAPSEKRDLQDLPRETRARGARKMRGALRLGKSRGIGRGTE